MKLRNIELDDETSTRAELYVCSQLGYIGCSPGWIRFFVGLASSSCGYFGKFDLFIYVNMKILFFLVLLLDNFFV